MVGVGQTALIEKHTIAKFPRSPLERQRDQVAKTTLGQCVLIGEETVIGIEPDPRSVFHRFGQQVRAKFPRERRRDRLLEKQPDVSPIARARPLEGRRQIQPMACFQYGLCVVLPMHFIEVGRKEETGLIPEQRVHAHDELPLEVVVSAKMPTNDVVRHGQKILIRTYCRIGSSASRTSPAPIHCHTRAHIRTCRSGDSQIGADRHLLDREIASETMRSWTQAGTDDGQSRRTGSWKNLPDKLAKHDNRLGFRILAIIVSHDYNPENY